IQPQSRPRKVRFAKSELSVRRTCSQKSSRAAKARRFTAESALLVCPASVATAQSALRQSELSVHQSDRVLAEVVSRSKGAMLHGQVSSARLSSSVATAQSAL